MCTATDQGQTIPGDKILMSTETSCHLDHLLQVKKKKKKKKTSDKGKQKYFIFIFGPTMVAIPFHESSISQNCLGFHATR